MTTKNRGFRRQRRLYPFTESTKIIELVDKKHYGDGGVRGTGTWGMGNNFRFFPKNLEV